MNIASPKGLRPAFSNPNQPGDAPDEEGSIRDGGPEPLCSVCSREVGPSAPRVGAKKRAKLIGLIDDVKRPLCCQCYSRFRLKKAKKFSDHTLRNRLAQKLALIYEESIPSECVELVEEARRKIALSDTQISQALRNIQNLSTAQGALLSVTMEFERAYGALLFAQYPARRAAADYAISRTELRVMVFARDGFKCVSCAGGERLSVDHKIPVARGGTDDLNNLQTLCRSCNSKKGTR